MLAIYCRISQLKEEGKDRSIKEQRLLGIAKAKELNLPYEVFTEEGVSGTLPVNKRPELEKIISGIEEGKYSAMYIYLQDRLERNPEVRFYVNRILKENDAKLYTEGGEVNLNDEDSTMLGDMQSIFNAHYVRSTKKRVKAVLKRNASEGKAHGISPYGYAKDDNGFIIIDEEEAEIVKRIYDMSLNGTGTNKIAELFNEEEIQTRYNKISKGTLTTKDRLSGVIRTKDKKDIKWSGNTIRNILINPIYKGERNFGGNVYQVPNIIKPSYWQKVNDNLKKNRNNSGKSVKHKYLLRGLMTCNRCGRNYYGRTRLNKKDHYYMCSSKRTKVTNCGNKSLNIDVAEDFIWSRFFLDETLNNKVKEHFHNNNNKDRIKAIRSDLKDLNDKLITNEKKQNKAIELVLNGFLSDEDVKSKINALKSDNQTTKIIISNLNDELDSIQNLESNSDNVIKELSKIKKSASFNQKKELIDKYIKNIEILGLKNMYLVKVSFNLNLSSEGYLITVNRSTYIAKEIYGGKNITSFDEYKEIDLPTELAEIVNKASTPLSKDIQEDFEILMKEFKQ